MAEDEQGKLAATDREDLGRTMLGLGLVMIEDMFVLTDRGDLSFRAVAPAQ